MRAMRGETKQKIQVNKEKAIHKKFVAWQSSYEQEAKASLDPAQHESIYNPRGH